MNVALKSIENLDITAIKGNVPSTHTDLADTAALRRRLKSAQAEWARIDTAVKCGQRTLLWGPPGTGKSFAGFSGIDPDKLSRLYLTLDTPAAEVRGHWVPVKDGFKWHDGPAVNAWRVGGRLLIDEIDAASGDTLTILLGILDDPESARMTLPSNELVRPKEGFACVATTNQIPTVLPEALLDRFDTCIHVTTPNPVAFLSPWHSKQVRAAAFRITYLSSQKLKGPGNRNIGLRAFKSIDRFVGAGIALDEAASMVLGDESGKWFSIAVKIAGDTL